MQRGDPARSCLAAYPLFLDVVRAPNMKLCTTTAAHACARASHRFDWHVAGEGWCVLIRVALIEANCVGAQPCLARCDAGPQ